MHALVETEGNVEGDVEAKEEKFEVELDPAIKQFIEKYDLNDLLHLLHESKLKINHLQALNTESMNEFKDLCQDWRLNTAQKIRFKQAIQSLPPISIQQRGRQKVTMLGEGRVGKTSLLLQMVNNTFTERQTSTFQASYQEIVKNKGNTAVHYAIWDTAGQERFHALAPIYYRDADIIFLVYDITDKTSFDKVKHWVEELHRIVGKNAQPILVIGNKLDLESKRQVDVKEVEEYVKSVDASHIEVSAKTKANFSKIYEWLRENTITSDLRPYDTGGFKLHDKIQVADDESKKKSSCC